MLKSYIDLKNHVVQVASSNRYADGKDMRLVNLDSIAIFSSCYLTTSTGKHLADISHVHIVSLMFKLITSAKDTKELFFWF